MQVSEPSTAAKTEGVAHTRPPVERWLRWTGLVPLPAFLALHLGRELWLAGASEPSQLVRAPTSPFALVSAALLVWLPFLLHCGLGLWLVSASPRRLPPDDVPRTARVISRACALVAFAFLLYHARAFPVAVLLGEADARDAGFRLVSELASSSYGVPLQGGLYLLGVAATLGHAGLGVHRALLLEGMLTSRERRRASARVCASVAAALFVLGALAVIRVATGGLLR